MLKKSFHFQHTEETGKALSFQHLQNQASKLDFQASSEIGKEVESPVLDVTKPPSDDVYLFVLLRKLDHYTKLNTNILDSLNWER